MPRKYIPPPPPNLSTPMSWNYVHTGWNMHNSALSTVSTRLSRLLPCRIFASALSYPPKVSTAPKISTCTIANPEITYVLNNGVLRYVVKEKFELTEKPKISIRRADMSKFVWCTRKVTQHYGGTAKRERTKRRMPDWLLFRSWTGWFFYVQNEKTAISGKFDSCTISRTI